MRVFHQVQVPRKKFWHAQPEEESNVSLQPICPEPQASFCSGIDISTITQQHTFRPIRKSGQASFRLDRRSSLI